MEECTDELPLVMQEIAEALQANAVALTMHPDGGLAPTVLFTDEATGVGRQRIHALLKQHVLWPEAGRGERPTWVRLGDACDGLVLPVQKIPSHSRLVISAFFNELDEAQRSAAEDVYVNRRPFAVGYFRLWQLDRTRSRRIDALETALNLTDCGVFLVSRAGDLVFSNVTGTAILDKGEGLRRSRGSICATELSDAVRLQVALEHTINMNCECCRGAASDQRAPVMTLQRSAKAPLIAAVMPAEKQASEPNDVAAILYVLDPARNTNHLMQSVCKLYHLSPVESRLTSLIAGGATLCHAAEQMRIKEQTARTYLKQIFLKTGTTRQGELIRLVLSSLIGVSSRVTSDVF